MDLPERFLLAAHSYGGFLSCLYACEEPHRVESMFLLSPVGAETYDPTTYEPLKYNDHIEPHKNLDPSWVPYQYKVWEQHVHPL